MDLMDTDNDRFPLHTAAREGRATVAEALLKADPKLSQRKDDDGRYPVHWAASSNNLDIMLLLANQRSFDPDVQDESGWSPLMISASVPDSEPILKLLIQRGADINLKTANGQVNPPSPHPGCSSRLMTCLNRLPSTSWLPRRTWMSPVFSSKANLQHPLASATVVVSTPSIAPPPPVPPPWCSSFSRTGAP
ncbi:ankyrin repeat-containing domain protein [Ilyonectria sp. MPI-CAGE-AT-0026]|nr:ankyrin repeat-containing domain protein [Ilyonectria sp. MPI-CAGE-AT-0026]